MSQEIINWVMGGFGTLLGFILNAVWRAVNDLQVADKELAEKVGAIEVLVAGAYVKKDDLAHSMTAVFTKLDRIEDRINKLSEKRE